MYRNDICNQTGVGDTTLCPSCEKHCPFVSLYQSCLLSQITYTFDNDMTVFFAIFMSFWATTFMEFWKRRQVYHVVNHFLQEYDKIHIPPPSNSYSSIIFRQAVIAWQWDLTNFEEDEQTRPEFEANVKTNRINPVTRKPEPYLSPWSKGIHHSRLPNFQKNFSIIMQSILDNQFNVYGKNAKKIQN